jgi:CBS domain-containing protein
MSRDCPMIDKRTPLQTFVEENLLRTGQRCFIVVDNGTIAGLVTPSEVKPIPRERWAKTTVAEVMRPLQQLKTIARDAPVTEALEIIGRDDVNQLPVTSNGHLEGVISRGHIVRLLQTRAELNM